MGQVGEVLVNLLGPPIVATLIGAVALGLGALLVAPFFPEKRAPLVESFAAGTLAISLLTFLWSIIGWMGPSARWALALPLILAGVLGWIQSRPYWALNPASFQNRTILMLGLVLAVGVLLRIILSPLYPPIALDECRSHLPTALSVLDFGRMIFRPEISFNGFPQNAEMLYLWGIMKAPLTTSHYINFIAFLFSLTALIRLGRAVFSVKIGWLAAVIMASMGSLQALAGQASPDMWVLFYTLAATLVLVEGIREGTVGRILLGGILLGGAAGVSYMSLIAASGLALSILAFRRGFAGFGEIPRWTWLAAIGLLVLVALPWYLRNIFWFLNPVFPFYSSVFPPGGGMYGHFGPECSLKTGWIHGAETASYHYQQGELWPAVLNVWSTWVAIPAGVWFWRSSPFIRAATVWTLLIWGFWMISGGGIIHFPYYIYLVPVNVLILANLLGVFYSLPSGDKAGRFFRIVLWSFLIGWVGIGGAASALWVPPLTSELQDNSLRRIHGSYDLIMAANEVIAEDRKAVGILCEDGRLYADFELLGGGDVGWANHRLIADSCTSPEALATLLHERYYASYLIIHEERLREKEQETVVFSPIKAIMRSPGFHELFREDARVGVGVVYYVRNPEVRDVPSVDPIPY